MKALKNRSYTRQLIAAIRHNLTLLQDTTGEDYQVKIRSHQDPIGRRTLICTYTLEGTEELYKYRINEYGDSEYPESTGWGFSVDFTQNHPALDSHYGNFKNNISGVRAGYWVAEAIHQHLSDLVDYNY